MPILDFNGTTAEEIGKVFDWNGTTEEQLGKVFDWNGTTDSLIYNAEIILKGGSVNYNYCSTSAQVYTFATWDLSEVTTLPITVTGNTAWNADRCYYKLYLEFADGTRYYFIDTSSSSTPYMGGSYSVNLSGYSAAQKASVKVQWQTYITFSVATNKYNLGNLKLADVTIS